MDSKKLETLYASLKKVLFDTNLQFEDMSREQIIFAEIFEQTVTKNMDVMESYSAFVDKHPTASLSELHSYCLAACLGKRYNDEDLDQDVNVKPKKTFH